MENEHVLGGLTRKRAEIAGKIEHTQDALRKLVIDLDAINAAIRFLIQPPTSAQFIRNNIRHVMRPFEAR
jgi:hypothetical protein